MSKNSLLEEFPIFANLLLPILTISKNFNTQRGTGSKGTDKIQQAWSRLKTQLLEIAGPKHWWPNSIQDTRYPETQWPCVILLITLAKTGTDEFIPRDEFTRHPRTTILTQSQLKTILSFFLLPSNVMYVTKNYFYSSKVHPLPPTPKTPLKQA